MAEIQLANGGVTLVDDADLPLVKDLEWKWQEGRRGNAYVYSHLPKAGGYRKVYLHRLILGATQKDQKTDHINGNGLDNRRSNLRICSNAENLMNMHDRRGYSRFKGVAWAKRAKKWRAYIYNDARQVHLGYYHMEEDAARAYDVAAIFMFGAFANLNFPEQKTA